MSEKVVLPKEIAEAVESYREDGFSNAAILTTALTNGMTTERATKLVYFVMSEGNTDVLMSALVNGFKVEQTPEEKVREYYEDRRMSHEGSLCWYQADAIEQTLNLLGIKIEGINA